MALRLVEVVVPADRLGETEEEVAESPSVVDCWREELMDGRVRVGFLIDSAAAEPLVDGLERRFEGTEGFRVVLLSVEAAIPRVEPKEEAEEEPVPEEEREEEAPPAGRVGREEMRAEMAEAAALTPGFLVMTGLSAVVCAFGLWMGDVAVVIGAMVIAPLLGPVVAVSLAVTLADGKLGREGMKSATAGFALALVLAVLLGVWLPVEPDLPQIELRSSVGLGHVGLALAAGSAGTLAFTTGTAAAVIGVMVAIALVPPLVAAGMMLGAGYLDASLGAFHLTLVTVIGLNLAGVVTFLGQGIRPHRWWEAERARRATAIAVVVWAVLLALLAAAIMWRG